MDKLSYFISTFFDLLIYLVIARVILSWFRPRKENTIIRFIISTSQPIMNIAGKILPPIGMIDFSPIIAILGLQIIRYLILQLLMQI